jgi:hypothetical protein
METELVVAVGVSYPRLVVYTPWGNVTISGLKAVSARACLSVPGSSSSRALTGDITKITMR